MSSAGTRQLEFRRADLVFLAVPSKGLAKALAGLEQQGVVRGAGIVSLAKGLVPPRRGHRQRSRSRRCSA